MAACPKIGTGSNISYDSQVIYWNSSQTVEIPVGQTIDVTLQIIYLAPPNCDSTGNGNIQYYFYDLLADETIFSGQETVTAATQKEIPLDIPLGSFTMPNRQLDLWFFTNRINDMGIQEYYDGINAVTLQPSQIPPPVVTAGFTLDPIIGHAPLTVTIHSTSTGGNDPPTYDSHLTHIWDMDDGTPPITTDNFRCDQSGTGGTPTSPDFIYHYQFPGTYTISLTATINTSCVATFGEWAKAIQTIEVLEPYETMIDFIPSTTSCYTPCEVTFTNTSYTLELPTTFVWDFGDGSPQETSENAIHTYTAPGIYDVTLTAINDNGTFSRTKNALINVGVCAAEFPWWWLLVAAGAGGIVRYLTKEDKKRKVPI